MSCELTNSSLLPESCCDMYEWYKGRKAPKQQRYAFTKTVLNTVMDINRAKENFSIVSQNITSEKKGKGTRTVSNSIFFY